MQQTVAYCRKTATGSLIRLKSQVQDDTYGVAGKAIKAPHTLGFVHPDGSLLTHGNLLAEMKKPVWGPDGNQLFKDLIPDFPAKVPEMIGTDYWPWFDFDPDDPDTYPTSQYPPGAPWIPGLNNFRGWECQDEEIPNMLYQNMHWFNDDPQKALNIWTACGITRYRRQKETGDQCMSPNPEYATVEAQRADAFEEYCAQKISTFLHISVPNLS